MGTKKEKKELAWYKAYVDNIESTNHKAHEYASEWADREVDGVECEDCGDKFLKEVLIPWRYESEVKLCTNCTENRDDEEEGDDY